MGAQRANAILRMRRIEHHSELSEELAPALCLRQPMTSADNLRRHGLSSPNLILLPELSAQIVACRPNGRTGPLYRANAPETRWNLPEASGFGKAWFHRPQASDVRKANVKVYKPCVTVLLPHLICRVSSVISSHQSSRLISAVVSSPHVSSHQASHLPSKNLISHS